MYARIMSADINIQQLDKLMQAVEDGIVPSAREQTGFEGMIGLVDQTTGHALLISLWKTSSDLENTETSGYLQSQISRTMPFLNGPAFRETYQVVLHVPAVPGAGSSSEDEGTDCDVVVTPPLRTL